MKTRIFSQVPDPELLRKNLLRLVEVPSVSGSRAEREMPFLIQNLMLEIEYFKENPHHISLVPVTGDAAQRALVIALLRGNGTSPETVVLLSHYDVVGTSGYGNLEEYAYRPLELAEKMKATELPADAARDLGSGDYLFGRGVLDMKYGIALHIELIRVFSARRDALPGNILLLSVPDEEADSLGMRAAVSELLRLKSEGLNLTAVISSEPQFPRFPGDDTKYIYTGTVGKLLPLVFCRGQETHAGVPYSGLNPYLMLSEIIRHIELNPDLADRGPGIIGPPPVCLKIGDFKSGYSVQTPVSAYAYFNFITLSSGPRQVMKIIKQTVRGALAGSRKRVRSLAELWPRNRGSSDFPTSDVPVYSLAEFTGLCCRTSGKSSAQIAEEINTGVQAVEPREATAEYIHLLSRFAPPKPCVVISFAPPYYPHHHLSDSPADRRVKEVVLQMLEHAEHEYGECLVHLPFFPALSDMSYLRPPENLELGFLVANTPLWGSRYYIPLEEMSRLNLPFINIGPAGKDAHQFTERLSLPFSMRIAPGLACRAIEMLLQK